MKEINKIARVITRILEIFHWVGAGILVAATMCSVVAPDKIGYFIGIDSKENGVTKMTVYDFEVNATCVDGNIDMTTFLLFGIGAAIILILMAIVYHNMYLIFKRSNENSPFQKENIKMFRCIGLFSIAVPVVGIVMSFIVRFVIGVDAAEVSVNQSGFYMGIVILCLTHYLAMSVKKQN